MKQFHNDSVSDGELIMICFGLPVIVMVYELIICIIQLVKVSKMDFFTRLYRFKFKNLIDLVLSVTLCLFSSIILVELLKRFIARPRPDYFDRCFNNKENNSVKINLNNITEINLALKGYYAVEGTSELDRCNDGYNRKKFIEYGRKSFPSGHSGFTAASFWFFILYFCGKFKTFATKPKNEEKTGEEKIGEEKTDEEIRIQIDKERTGKWSVCGIYIGFLLSFGILYMMCSRLQDNRHHPEDVLAGALI